MLRCKKCVKTKKKNSKYVNKTVKYMLNVVWQKRPSLYFAYLLAFFSQIIDKVRIVVLPKFLIDELVLAINGSAIKEHIKCVVIYVSLICGSIFLSNLMSMLANHIKTKIAQWFVAFFDVELTNKVVTMDYQYTESPEMIEKLQRAKSGIDQYSGGVIGITDGIYDVICNIVFFVGIGITVLLICPWLFPIQIVSLSTLAVFNAKCNAIELQNYEKRVKIGRRYGYYMYHLTDISYGKEIRLYNGIDIINEKVQKSKNEMESIEKKINREQCVQLCRMDVINAVRDALSYFYVGYLALKKKIGLGDFSMCIASASELYHGVRGIVVGCQELKKRCEYVFPFIEYMELPVTFGRGERCISGEKHTIELSHVCFKYPGSEEYILKDVSLTISQGEHLALVGMNGMGKTTLIKLICRLYDVTEGEILLDGININEYSEDEYRKLFSVVFQDYQMYAFSLKENVAFDKLADNLSVEHALRHVGFFEDAQELPKGLNTILIKGFDENAIELSGGQAQKVAIARALYYNAPIVILDEPTAALDPLAEQEVFAGLNILVKERTAIFISHRLSSCKFCDKIAVINNGRIEEYGTHEELLMLEDGLYAEMFHTQAQYYTEQRGM